ncbi:RHS repeat-associated core domain-containing protein [Actinoplanes sp. NPDC026619]|uniref:RHS repeat-associated core domain-containing protein n=1 Tax=Actinoplanes sp. NPDC026619 TaxID=3155798 RepID=UPI0033FA12C9
MFVRRSTVVLAIGVLFASQLTYSSRPDAAAASAMPARGAPALRAENQVRPVARAAASAQPADYAYDAAGQLRGVSHSADGAGARYSYDDAGNRTSVDRTAAGALTVSAIAPSRAPVGAAVAVSGTGFATTAAGNTVTFNGTAATVTSASAGRLMVTVPTGATSGAVAVTTGSATATGAQTFTVTPSVPAPVVSGFSPASGAAGTSVTITGSGFSAAPAENNVSFGRTRARVTAAAAISLTVIVPAAAVSGRISVATAGGTATATSDFVAVTQPFGAGDIGTGAVLTADGTATTVSFATAGKVAVLRFAGVKGQRLSLGLTGSTAGDITIYGYTPYGATFARDEYDQPWQVSTFDGGLAMPPLPTTGTYQIVLKPTSSTATGTVVATLSSKLLATPVLGGADTALTFSRPGQQAELTVDAQANQHIGLGFTGSLTGTLVAEVQDPAGTPVVWTNGYEYSRQLDDLPYGDVDFTTVGAGRYTVLLRSYEQRTGSLTVTTSAAAAGGALAVGTAKTVSVTRRGQDTLLTFAGTAGQNLGLDLNNVTTVYYPTITVLAPDGTTLTRIGAPGSWIDLPTLPATGTYALLLSTGSETGSYTATLVQPTSGGTLSLTGAGTAVTLSAGKAVTLTVAGTAGQEVTAAMSNWTIPSSADALMSVTGPDGGFLDDVYLDSTSAVTFPTATTGTYRLVLRAEGGSGGLTVTASPTIEGGALTVGTNKTITSPRLGQPTRMTFTGAVAQRLSMYISDYGYTYVVWVNVTRPDGSAVYSGWLDDLWLAMDPLTVAGTYRLEVQPRASTGGSLTFALVQSIDGGATAVGGAAKALTATAGRYVDTTIAVTAGQRLSFGFGSWTFAASTIYVRLAGPTGTVIFGEAIPKVASVDTYQLTAGTYRLSVMASDHAAGSVSVTVSAQISGGALALNTGKTVTASRLGQATWFTYAGTTGQLLSVAFTSVTMPYYPYVWVRRPAGSELAYLPGAATVSIPSLPATGTYEILIGPNSATGTAVATLKTRTSLAAPAAGGGAGPQRAPAATVPHRTHPDIRPSAKAQPEAGPAALPAAGQAGESWTPNAANLSGAGWTTGRGTPKPVPGPLRALSGATALSGRIRTLDDKPLPNVTVLVDGRRELTDANGLFLVKDVRPGHRVLRVDGSTANTPTRTFGLHDIGVDLAAGQTTVLPYTIWLSKLDMTHVVGFASPTRSEVTIETPAVPGLQVKLPAGTVVRDVSGKVVTQLGITAIPVDRPPFPLPPSQVPSYFTVQPGSAYLFPAGARVIYPNFTHAKPGAPMDFWHYDPAGKGWYVYGKGKVTPDGRSVEPDKGTEVYQFTGAMLITPGADPPPAAAPPAGPPNTGGDPVDLSTGLLVDTTTDLSVNDVIPLSLTRTYQPSDTGKRAFGVGASFNYGLDLYSENRFYECWLILPDGGRVRFHRTSPGGNPSTGYINAAFAADPTPSEFAGATLIWNHDGWDLRTTDGTTYVFGDESPLQAIRDKFGNTVTLTRAPAGPWTDGITRANGPITQITSPNGKWIKLSYDTGNRVTRAEDALGRSVDYGYDSDGHLHTVTGPDHGVTTYTYESGRLKTITDARGTTYLTNDYDANGRVRQQTLPGNATYGFAYTTDAAGKVTETRVTDPKGHVRRVTFNATGYSTGDTSAYGTTLERTTVITRDPASNRATASVDALGRRTEFGYDAYGQVTSIKQLAGTGDERTQVIARDGPFGQISKTTDGLDHSTVYGYQADGALHTITDPMGRKVTIDTNEAGQASRVTDNDNKQQTLSYALGDLAGVTDALGNTTRRFQDAAGRTLRTADPAGAVATWTYDGAGHLAAATDPLGRTTGYQYDANGNLHVVTDARQHTTTYNWDSSDRLSSVVDPLQRTLTYTYDAAGNPATTLDGRHQTTRFDYDELDRLKSVRYAVDGDTQESQTTYTYDAGNRVRTIADSAGGATTFTPDALDRLVAESGPSGDVGYGYDDANRRTSMTLAGQPDTIYGYNDADQLTSVVRGSEQVGIGYDTVGRRKTVTLPAGVTQTYGYNADGDLTGLTYGQGGTTLGDIAYTLDTSGRITHVDGSYARVDLPGASGPAAYDAADQLSTNTYDDDGNLTSDGGHTYTWNARGQLTGQSGPDVTATYTYDGLGRRTGRTTGGAATAYLYDGPNAVQEKTGGAISATMLTGGLDETFARTTADGSRSLLTDGLGSTVALAGSSGVGAEYSYDPFGRTTVAGDDGDNDTRFTGRTDEGDGLYYYRARYYSATDGRFLSRDPVGLASGGTNAYTYVSNQPTNLIDPNGTKPRAPGADPECDPAVEDCGARIVDMWGNDISDPDPIAAELKGHTDQALTEWDNGQIGYSPKDLTRIAKNPHMADTIKGNILDGRVKELAGNNPALSDVYPNPAGYPGPDFVNGGTRTDVGWYDLTTGRMWGQHMFDYGPTYGPGIGILWQ